MSTNNSGAYPKGHAVLVEPYTVEATTTGGILLPPSVREKDELAEQKAVIIEIGPSAWEDERVPRASVGDHIMFSKFAGYSLIGPKDGKVYRVINDRDVFLGIDPPEGASNEH